MLSLWIGAVLLASSPVRTYDAVVQVVFREDTVACLPDAAANAFRLQLQGYRIDGVPKPLVPRLLVSTARFASLAACWREALALTDRNLGRDLDERVPVEVEHESFEIETPRHPIFMDRYIARLQVALDGQPFEGREACEARTYRSRRACLEEGP